MKEQNFQNHTRMVTGFHYVLFAIILTALILSCMHLFHEIGMKKGFNLGLILVLLSFGILLTAWFSRVFALKAQDRAIRAEENFRYFVLTGKPLDSNLRLGQIVALRFASNDEMVALAQKAVDQKLKPKQIKSEIQNWKADHHRV
jgi:Family of unknown function (DUF6526)